MEHRYLIVDGERGGTGLRYEFQGFISTSQLAISMELQSELQEWQGLYEKSSFDNAPDSDFYELDKQGLELMVRLANELGAEYKVRYYSDAKCRELKLLDGNRIVEL